MIFDNQHLMKIEAQRRESPDIERLLAERNQLLKEHPHLVGLQKEIDALLGTTLDPARRLEIIFMIMAERLLELKSAFAEVFRLAREAGAR